MMKKNAFQILTSVLCFVLLVITFCLAKKIEMLEQQTENRIEYLQDSLNQKMQNLYADFHRELEASNSVVEELSLEPVGLDSDTGNLAANLLVQLKQWSEDTVVTLYAEMD